MWDLRLEEERSHSGQMLGLDKGREPGTGVISDAHHPVKEARKGGRWSRIWAEVGRGGALLTGSNQGQVREHGVVESLY